MKKILLTTIAFVLAYLNVAGTVVRAQTAFDITPPTIKLDELAEGVAGETQIFTALVEDDVSIHDVKLYYRYTGQNAFTNIPMKAIGNSSYYSASVTTDAAESRVIEYYLQARDDGGNRVVRGFAFEPLTRTLQPPASTSRPAPVVHSTDTQGGGFKWWYVALGVLAVGAAASLAGGSSGGGGGNQIPFQIAVSPPE